MASDVTAITDYLRQFESTEWMARALILLEHIDYFPRARLEDIFEEFHSGLDGNVKPKATFAVLGGPQDSSNALAYYCSKVFKGTDRERFKTLVDVIRTYKAEEVVVFLIDDNLGSGGNAIRIFQAWLGLTERGSVAKLNDDEKAWLKKADLRYFVLIDFVDKGHERLKVFLADHGVRLQIEPAITTQEREGCFKPTANVFSNAAQREAARRMAASIGYELLDDEHRSDDDRRLFALGYGGSQKLIVFEWNTPTSTLPILWKTGTWHGKPWKPLFPRR